MKAEMVRLQEELEALTKKHDNLHRQVAACRSLTTLPRRLPADVLREIFCQCLPTNHNAPLSVNDAPLIFMRICGHWRQVALSTPRIWSTIHVHVLHKPHDPRPKDPDPDNSSPPGSPALTPWDQRRAALSSQWLQRSGVLPLHISLFDKSASPALFNLYLEPIIPFASRLRSLFLQASWPLILPLSGIEATDLPSLETLFLDLVFGPGDNPYSHLYSEGLMSAWENSGIFTAPSLRKLSIRKPLGPSTVLKVNWSKLTHLDLGGPSGQWWPYLTMFMASDLLRPCKSLVYCRLEIATTYGWQEPQLHPMHLPLLRTLSIQTEDSLLPFIIMLDVPAIEEIDFHYIGTDVNHTASLAPLVQRGTIRKLVIDALYLSQESFLECLRQCHILTSLTVKQSPVFGDLKEDRQCFKIDDGFLEFISSDDGSALCPAIEELICEHVADFSTSGMVKFIKRKQDGHIRFPGLARLKKVAILNIPTKRYDLQSYSFSDELEAYIADGLSFHVDLSEAQESQDLNLFEQQLVVDFGNSALQYADCWRD